MMLTRKNTVLCESVLLCGLLTACAAKVTVATDTLQESITTNDSTPAVTAEPTPELSVCFFDQEIPLGSTSILLEAPISDLSELRELLPHLPYLKEARVLLAYEDQTATTDLFEFLADWDALISEYPDIVFSEQLLINGLDAEELREYTAESLSKEDASEVLPGFLRRCPQLKTLRIGSEISRDAIVAAVRENPSLQILWSDPVFGESDSSATQLIPAGAVQSEELISYLACFPELKYLDLMDTTLTEAEGDAICAAFPTAAVHRTVTLNDRSCDSYSEQLDFSKAQIENPAAFSSALQYFPFLKRLEMHYCSLSNAELAAIRDRYPQTKVVWTVRFNRWRVSTDAVAFSTLQLAPNDNRVRSSDAQVLQYCTDLIALDLGHNNLIDLEWLRPLKNLQVLILADNSKLSDISPIGDLKKLKYLELFMTSVSDITPLSNLTELLDVNLCFTKITDATPLLACKKLERIWLGRDTAAQIGEEGILQLQNAFPNAAYDLVSRSSTYLGWREHPRYHAYIQMFRTNTAVEPFLP